MVCSSCQRARAKFKVRQSKMIPAKLMLCDDCFEQRFEPRSAVILAYRAGNELAREYIKRHLYVGDPIRAAEILNPDTGFKSKTLAKSK